MADYWEKRLEKYKKSSSKATSSKASSSKATSSRSTEDYWESRVEKYKKAEEEKNKWLAEDRKKAEKKKKEENSSTSSAYQDEDIAPVSKKSYWDRVEERFGLSPSPVEELKENFTKRYGATDYTQQEIDEITNKFVSGSPSESQADLKKYIPILAKMTMPGKTSSVLTEIAVVSSMEDGAEKEKRKKKVLNRVKTAIEEQQEKESAKGQLLSDGFQLSDIPNIILSTDIEIDKLNEDDLYSMLTGEARDADFWDVTLNAAKRGYYNSRYGEESYKAMMGEKNDKAVYEQILNSNTYNFTTSGDAEGAVSGAAELLGQQFRQFTNPTSVALAGAGATGAAIAGQAGPQIALPEELLTIPGAFLIGLKSGSATSAFEIEAGLSYNEMIEAGVSEETARAVALGVGTVNAGLDMAQVDDLVKAYKAVKATGAAKSTAKMLLRELAKRGVSVATETAQEVAQEGVTILGTQAATKAETGEWAYSFDEWGNRILDTAKSSALSFGFMNVPAATKNTASIVNDRVNTNKWTKAIESALGGETNKDALTENEQAVVDKVFEERIAEEEADGTKLTKKEKNKIYDSILKDLEEGGISTDTIESVLGGETYKTYKDTIASEDAQISQLEKQIKALEGEQNTVGNAKKFDSLQSKLDELKNTTKRYSLREQLDNEILGLVNGSKLVESYNERTRRGQAFEADLTKYNGKQQETIKRAVESGILNNTNRTHKFVDFIAKISADKGVLFDFTNNEKLKESGFAVDGKIVNGYVTKDGVTLNIQSAKALESVVGHEVAHILEGTELYTELQNSLFAYAKSKGDFQSRLDRLTKLYENIADADVNAELTADLVGDYIFNDTDFVNRLSTENRNVFQKIYDEIKYLCKVATAGSKELRQLEKIKSNFVKAYRANGKASGDTKYSLGYHAGDLGKAEGYWNMMSANRGTGHFGTGTYFVGDEAKISDSHYGNRPHEKVEFDNYHLYKPVIESDGFDLHSALKYINDNIFDYPIAKMSFNEMWDVRKKADDAEYTLWDEDATDAEKAAAQKTLDEFKERFESIGYDPDHMDAQELYEELSDISKEYRLVRSKLEMLFFRDFGNLSYDEQRAKIDSIMQSIYDEVSQIEDAYAARHEDSPSTRFMKAMGYEGIDVRGFKGLDNTTYGSVIYDLKGEDLARKKELGTAKYSLSDSDGKQLSKGQQEYFKDSKMRDENGNLKVMYHGSPETFTEFDRKKARASGYYGNGFYFTDSDTHAKQYGNTYEVYLNITNPLRDGTNDITKEQLRKFVEVIADNEDYGIDNYGYGATVDSVTDSVYGKSDFAMLMDINASCVGNMVEAIELFNEVNGTDYNGIIAPTETVAFYPNQIKSTANTEPTKAADIRYSLSEADSTYFSAVEKGDTEMAQKMVDDAAKNAGYEHQMFHETDADNIHIFDIARGDHGATDYETPYGIFTKTSAKNIGLGSKQMALFVKAQNTLRVENREDVRNKIPGFTQYYDQIQEIDNKYDAIAEQLEDEEFDALQEWMMENPDADMDVVYPTSYIIEGKPADIDSARYLEAHRKYQENKAEWQAEYDAVAVKAKEFITKWLRSNGYDSMYFKVDGGSRGRQTDSLIVLDTNQVKSADAVTYDDNGNVIPLSERFDPDNKDIRYSLSEKGEQAQNGKFYGKDIALESAPVAEESTATVSKTENVSPVAEKTPSAVLHNMRDGKNGWGAIYGTAQEALNDAVQSVDQELWFAINQEIENSVGTKNAVTPMTSALIAVQEDVRQETITPMQGAQLLSEAYNHGGANALRGLYNPKTGNLYNRYLEKAKQYATVAEKSPVTENKPVTREEMQELFPDDLAPAAAELENLYAERDLLYQELENALDTGTADDVERLSGRYDALAARIREMEAEESNRVATLDDADAPPEREAPMSIPNAPIDNPFYDRDFYTVGNRKVKAYMYENPEVKSFFQEEAMNLRQELSDTQKAERWYNDQVYYDTNGEHGFGGNKRHASDSIAEMLDSWGMSYADIEKGLNAIIEDNGAENIAAAKKIEFMLNDRLLHGYKDFYTNKRIEPNQEYIRMLEEKQVMEYTEEARESFFRDADSYAPTEDIAPSAKTGFEEPAVNPKKSVGAAPYGFDPVTHLQYKYGTIPDGENPVRDDSLPKSTNGKDKVSYTARTVKGAKATPDELVDLLDKETVGGRFSYIPIKNSDTVRKAYDAIVQKGWEAARGEWEAKVRRGDVSAEMTATGALLLNNAAKAGDRNAWLSVLQNYQLMGTNAGQAVQAMRILKTLTPDDSLYMIERSVEQMVEDMKLGTEIVIDDNLKQAYLNAKTDSERDAARKALAKNIAKQIPSTAMDKWTALRYLNMLGNLRTQGRNIIGNLGMTVTSRVKNAVATGIEAIAEKVSGGKFHRTKSLFVSTDQLKAAKNDFANVEFLALNGGKFNDTTAQSAQFQQEVQDARKIFDLAPLEGYRRGTNWAMDTGDLVFSKAAYGRALAGYLKANGITETDFSKIDQQTLDEARAYAIKEAQETTFRDNNWLSSWVSKVGRRKDTPKVGKLLSEGVMPFRKTPANILLRAEEYSPLGIANATVKSIQAAKGAENVTGADVVNSWAKAFTGTGLFALGILLNNSGILSGGPDEDDDKEWFEDLYGWQNYAIQIGDYSFTIDFLSPAAMPLLMGAQLNELRQEGGVELADLETALLSIADPMIEMSMLQGVNDSLDNIRYAESNMGQFLVNACLSYLTQGLTNSFLGQIERSFDGQRMTTYVDNDSGVPAWLQKALGKASAKTPGWDYQQIPYVDAWGETEDIAPFVALPENTLSPSYISEGISDELYEELNRLNDAQSDINVYPQTPDKTVTFTDAYGNRHEDYKLSAEEYVELAKLQGQTQRELVEDILSSDLYSGLTDKEKAKAVQLAYQYAREYSRQEVLGADGFSAEWMAEAEDDIVNAIISHTNKEMTFAYDYPEKYSFFKENDMYEAYAAADEDGKRAYNWAAENPGKYKVFADDFLTFYGYKQEINTIKKNHIGKGEKDVVTDYIDDLDMDYGQKIILYRSMYNSKADKEACDDDIIDYLNSRDDITRKEKKAILEELGID